MCGILGIVSKSEDVPIKIYEGLTYLQHRGQDSSGICNSKDCIKKDGLVKDVFNELNLKDLFSNTGIGQVRYGTNGSFNKKNIHLEYTKYHSFKYKQQWNEFIPDLSILDYIFNHGFDWGLIESNNLED